MGYNFPIKHISSKEIIVDITTRYETSLLSIGRGSLRQNWPQWLCKPLNGWPSTRSFAKRKFQGQNVKVLSKN